MRVIVRRERPHPGRATASVRATRRLALRSLRHQHHGRPARLSRGPPPGPCTGRGPYPPHQGQWPGTVSVAGVQHQPDLADDHPDRSRPDRVDPPARLRRRRRHVGNLRAEGGALPISSTCPPDSLTAHADVASRSRSHGPGQPRSSRPSRTSPPSRNRPDLARPPTTSPPGKPQPGSASRPVVIPAITPHTGALDHTAPTRSRPPS